ncbi:MAG: DUF3800 domain-containing protein [Patescibacteria group bacterium]|nr:DUF3800 domain-containing protein [Patescibacteria group bacterium]MDD5121648.1 DUF3800 domain-containing protein [Patescibacteria group bacterium]MDD5221898.1 DUF3800 domain-containing protein [Patescibacteria group bacterium]MDD5396188.1 DUF3800 domain-containing protein [Patescibacteria group bacterium]
MFRLFGRSDKELKLGDYKNIWTKFCFLDESGSLNDTNAPFFSVGLIKCSQPYYLNSLLTYKRNEKNFHDELKFNKLSRKNINFAKLALECFLNTKSIWFYSYLVDKKGVYFLHEFDSNPWIAYEEISIKLIEAALAPSEILIVIADHVTTPPNIKYEVDVKKKINEQHQCLSVAGVCRIDSRANDMLQLVDLMIGAINYDLKLKSNLVSGDKNKIEFLEYFKTILGIKDFVCGFKNKQFNIFVDKDVKKRPFGQNEKEPSS